MHTIASAEVLTFVSIGLLVGLVVVLVLQVLTSKRVQQLTLPMYEYAEAQSRAEAEKIIREARAAAATIIAEASSTSAALAKKRQEDIDAFAAAHKTSLESIAAKAAKTLEEGATRAGAAAEKIGAESREMLSREASEAEKGIDAIMAEIESLQSEIATKSKAIQSSLDEGNRSVLAALSRTFDEASAAGTLRIEKRIDAIIAASEADVAAYAEAKKRLVDERMADLVIDTSTILLGKALTLDDHTDLVERALSDARAEGLL